MEKIEAILKKINKRSIMPLENEPLFGNYAKDSLECGKMITFFNWECPPRTLDMDKTGNVFLNYCVDLEKIFRGEKLDYYTEMPRVVAQKNREIRALRFLKSLGLKFRFIKIIADTNAYYITPQSLKASGKRKLDDIFSDFKLRIDGILEKDYKDFRTGSLLFTSMIKRYRREYESALSEALSNLNSGNQGLVRPEIWKKERDYIQEHVGFNASQRESLTEFTKKVIATYAAEGVIFAKLSETDDFSNCVWLNIEEPSFESIEITNCLRNKKGLGKLPMIFPE